MKYDELPLFKAVVDRNCTISSKFTPSKTKEHSLFCQIGRANIFIIVSEILKN